MPRGCNQSLMSWGSSLTASKHRMAKSNEPGSGGPDTFLFNFILFHPLLKANHNTSGGSWKDQSLFQVQSLRWALGSANKQMNKSVPKAVNKRIKIGVCVLSNGGVLYSFVAYRPNRFGLLISVEIRKSGISSKHWVSRGWNVLCLCGQLCVKVSFNSSIHKAFAIYSLH